MTQAELLEDRAFRMIQNDVVLWRKWNDAKTTRDRLLMQLEMVYTIGLAEGARDTMKNFAK